MNKFISWIVVILLLSFPLSAFALQESRPLPSDQRLHVITYNPNAVHKYIGYYDFQSSIVFGDDEKIETISIGNPNAWKVEPLGNRLFIKPIADTPEHATTNMLVITNSRLYNFVLEAREVGSDGINEEGLVFETRFLYPDNSNEAIEYSNNKSGAPDLSEPEKYNFNYSMSGSSYIAPLRVFDDGTFTYFQFAKNNAELPAFFIVDSAGREALVNYRVTDDYIVIERVASQFTLRNGPDVTCVFNETMPLKLIKEKD